MLFSAKDNLLLRYLSWKESLLEHPDYRRQKGGFLISETDLSHERMKLLSDVELRLVTGWRDYVRDFSYRVDVVSDAFILEVYHAAGAFMKAPKICGDYLAGRTFKGTVLLPHLNRTAIAYRLVFDDGGAIDWDASVIMQLADYSTFSVYKDKDYEFGSNSLMAVNAGTGELVEADEDTKMKAGVRMTSELLRSYLLFCHFAQVRENMVVRTGTRDARKVRSDRDDLNDTTIPLRRMTAQYYTTTVRSEGFSVRGHMRLQPCGPGRTDHRLIYIEPFEKKGYTRKAQILARKDEDEFPTG